MSAFEPGQEVEVVAGVHRGAVVRLRGRDADRGWLADCAGSRPIFVREDHLCPRNQQRQEPGERGVMLINYAEAARAARDVAMACGDVERANVLYMLADTLKDLADVTREMAAAEAKIARLTAERDAALALLAAKGA